MAQFLRPIADSTVLGWTGSSGGDLYQFIDESSASDADYIEHEIQNDGGIADNQAEFQMTAGSTPDSGAGTVRVRAWMTTVGPYVETPTIEVALKEAGTLVFSDTQVLSPSETTYEFAVSSGIMAGIADWGDLQINLTATDGDDALVMRVSWLEFETPDAAGGSGGFTLTNQALGNMRMLLRDRPDRYGNGMTREFQRYFRDNPVVRTDVFQYDEPLSASDSENGRICTESGYWFPGRRVVYVDGRPYGDIFAPETYLRQKKGPNAWDFE